MWSRQHFHHGLQLWALRKQDAPVGNYTITALVDLSSVCSYINTRMVEICVTQGWRQTDHDTITIKAGGTEASLGLSLIGSLRATKKTIRAKVTVICTITGPVKMADLPPKQRKIIEAFLARQLQGFLTVKGVTPLTNHEIRLEDPTPIKQRYRSRNPATQKIINKEVDEMLAEGVIQPSSSPWNLPVEIVRRKDGKTRFCIDFRKLNQVSKKDAYPLS